MPHTLLLADDSATIQRVIELTFADEDVQVVSVSDGDAAIAAIDSSPPDIVLADVGMPGRSGYDVAMHVKRTPRLSHIPVVLITGAFEPIDQGRATAAGCDGVLAKPFEPQLVIGRVKELLARPRPAVPPGPPGSPDVDRYFDELDQKFATLGAAQGAAGLQTIEAPEAAADRSAADDRPEGERASIEAGTSSRYAAAEERGFEVPPISYGSPRTDFEAVGAHGPAATGPVPALADAFAALLAAEQKTAAAGAPVSTPPVWPFDAAPPAAPTLSEEDLEHVTRTVVERLSDRVVRETTAEIVSAVAERLVREEIERIKSHLK